MLALIIIKSLKFLVVDDIYSKCIMNVDAVFFQMLMIIFHFRNVCYRLQDDIASSIQKKSGMGKETSSHCTCTKYKNSSSSQKILGPNTEWEQKNSCWKWQKWLVCCFFFAPRIYYNLLKQVIENIFLIWC